MSTFDEFGKSSWLAPQGPREGLSRYAEVVRTRARLIVICLVVVTLVAALYASLASPKYKAESRLLITPISGQNNFVGLGLITDNGNPGGAISTAASLVNTAEVGSLVAVRTGQSDPRSALKG